MTTKNDFDDFLEGQPAGPKLDALAGKFSLTRSGGETDKAFLTRLEQAALGAVRDLTRYFPS
jgi:hypothetical protein